MFSRKVFSFVPNEQMRNISLIFVGLISFIVSFLLLPLLVSLGGNKLLGRGFAKIKITDVRTDYSVHFCFKVYVLWSVDDVFLKRITTQNTELKKLS